MSKLYPCILFCLCSLSVVAQVTFSQLPRDLQLYPRDANSQAEVVISGTINGGGYTKIGTQVFRANQLTKAVSQTLISASSQNAFRLAATIKAEPAEYSFRVFLYKGTDSTLVAERKRVVCGDVYILYGQSNAVAKAGVDTTYSTNFDDTYLRTCTYPEGSTNIPADMAWYPAKQPPAAVGGLGLTLQRLILQTYNIPTCVINGAQGGAPINVLTDRDPTNHANPITPYGQLLYRAQWANVAKQAKGFIWRQGEAETGSSTDGYEDKFRKLYDQLRDDFGNVRIYVAQINILANPLDGPAALRDFQRRNKYLFTNVETIATVGTPGYDGYHYSPTAYQRLAFEQFRQIARDVYGSTDTLQINSPDIKKAYYNAQKDSVTLVFDESMQMVWKSDTTIYNPATGAKVVTRYQKDYFSLDGNPFYVTGGYAADNRIVLRLLSTSNAKTIRYLPAFFSDNYSSFYDGPTLRNSRGMRAFSFDKIPIADALPAVKNLTAKALSDKQIQLSWMPPSADQMQMLERADGSAQNFKKIATLTGSAASYTDATLPDPLGTYYYRLRVYNAVSESPVSNVASVRPLVLALEPTDLALQLYPNPLSADRLLHIEAEQITFTQIQVYDLQGRVVKTWHGKARDSFTLALDNLPTGIYLAQLQTAEGHTFRQRVVIR